MFEGSGNGREVQQEFVFGARGEGIGEFTLTQNYEGLYNVLINS